MPNETQFFEFMERYRPYDNQFYHDLTKLKVTGNVPDQAIRRYYGVHTTLTTAGIYRENILLAVKNGDWKLAIDHLRLLAEAKNVDLSVSQRTSRDREELLKRMKEVNASNTSKDEKLSAIRTIAQRANELDNLNVLSTEEIHEEIESIELRVFTDHIPITDLFFNLNRLDRFKLELENRNKLSVNQLKYYIPTLTQTPQLSHNGNNINVKLNGYNAQSATYNIQEAANARLLNELEHAIPHLISKAYISNPKQKYPKLPKFANPKNRKIQKSPSKKKKEYRYVCQIMLLEILFSKRKIKTLIL